MKKFSLELEVRNNELDAQGIVNNANYMIYLSHARHKHGELLGINHCKFANQGLQLVITSCHMKFKNSLLANDHFLVSSELIAGELPFHWSHRQEIKRIHDGKIILKALFNATCIDKSYENDNKFFIPPAIATLISSP